MLRSFPRAISSSSPLRGTYNRANYRFPTNTPIIAPSFLSNLRQHQTRQANTHAISNPALAGIEKRWEGMPPQEQAELWMALRDRMKTDWHDLTWQEKKIAYWIAFGPHGPRELPPAGQGWWVFKWTVIYVAGSCVVFFIIRMFARPAPKTMNREWQEATNEYLRQQKVEPITGLSSEGYKGKGQVQSGPKRD